MIHMPKSPKPALSFLLLCCLLLPVSDLLAQQPSGKVVFSWFGDVYTYQFGSSDRIRLTNDGNAYLGISWSPDGTKIAYVSYQTNSSEIYVMNADGTRRVRLTTNTFSEMQITWSPDGSRIAFVSGRTGNSEVFVMNADGSNPINISNHSAFDFNPAWSPDGQQLLFSSERNGNLDIYAANVDGTNLRQLTSVAQADKLPVWSSDGTKIAFVRYVDCERIFVANSDGSNPVQVSDDLCDLAQVEWLPGTHDLLYLVDSTLFRLNADLSVQQLVILPTYGDDASQFDYWEFNTLPANSVPNATPNTRPTLPPEWTPTFTMTPAPPTATATLRPTATPVPTLSATDICREFTWETNFSPDPQTGGVHRFDGDGVVSVLATTPTVDLQVRFALTIVETGETDHFDMPGGQMVGLNYGVKYLPQAGTYEWSLLVISPLYGELCKQGGEFIVTSIVPSTATPTLTVTATVSPEATEEASP